MEKYVVKCDLEKSMVHAAKIYFTVYVPYKTDFQRLTFPFPDIVVDKAEVKKTWLIIYQNTSNQSSWVLFTE